MITFECAHCRKSIDYRSLYRAINTKSKIAPAFTMAMSGISAMPDFQPCPRCVIRLRYFFCVIANFLCRASCRGGGWLDNEKTNCQLKCQLCESSWSYRQENLRDAIMSLRWKSNNTKSCPNCGILVEKNGYAFRVILSPCNLLFLSMYMQKSGCLHMTCSRCNHSW